MFRTTILCFTQYTDCGLSHVRREKTEEKGNRNCYITETCYELVKYNDQKNVYLGPSTLFSIGIERYTYARR